MSSPENADFVHPLRIYWEDTDAGGVVFYANYLKYFERARTEWLRAQGIEQDQLRRDRQLVFVVTECKVRYLRPARLDDPLNITVSVVAAGRVAMTLCQRAWRGTELLVDAQVRVACVNLLSAVTQ